MLGPDNRPMFGNSIRNLRTKLMDRLDCMRLFVRVVERRSFTAAASDLGLSRSTATEAVKRLEAQLGARLLERTTRHVAATLDGQAYYHRCLSILAEVEDAESALRNAEPRGLLRVDAHPLLTRTFLLPRLPAFLERYPLVSLQLGQSDRLVDLVREGVDCVIRAGEPRDSGMVLRRLATIREATCASPDYLARHGVPASPDALEGHRAVGFVSSRSGEVLPLEFTVEGRLREVRLPSRVTANNSDTVAELARMGFGLVQAPRYRFERDLAEGRLVEVLADFPPSPTPLSALYPQKRQLAPRLRVFLDWAVEIFAAAQL
ncbi:DNA-binding transcriptional regulator, LysR family [Tistlia consotensis]|uniref:DNA-binding transcriptional regulator, LysR family n=2 Tax=Tistlia TaxID=1321364 RepID=A0A1Y6C9K1_9PROT|nr:DNA-binding transcriptional regulator, LysR family [Tistlia consotensis USBA 355]SNR73825.1 DNA-binding transcriptional regulator, LysR family [Tistlia consotensis]